MDQTTSGVNIPPYLNRTMKLILRSPVHGMVSKNILLITFTGRKSGKTYTTPVSYSQHGNQVYVFTHATWWKNLRGGAEVGLLLKRRPVTALAEPDLDTKSVEARMHTYLRHVPGAARPLGIRMQNGTANAEDISRTARDRLFVRLRL